MRGRKKIKRTICLDIDSMICSCMGPLKLSHQELKKLEKVFIAPDELQALAYKDLEQLSMQAAADKMDISKTVFARIYQSGRKKQTDCLINGKILIAQCDQQL